MSDVKALKVGLRSLAKSLGGRRFASDIRRAWGFSEEEYRSYQKSAFLRMYDFARARVPYYAQRAEEYPPLQSSGRSVQDILRDLPILRKAEVRAFNEALAAEPALPLTTVHTTSGTSGTPLKLPATYWERAYADEINRQWLRQLFGTRFPRSLVLSGFMTPGLESGDLYWTDRLTGSVYLSIYSLTEQNREEILRLIRSFRPVRVSGYPSAVHQLALLVGDALADTVETRTAMVTSEVLLPEWRDGIRKNLCGQVLDFYGSQEGTHLAIECSAGRMHVHPLVGIVEVVTDAGEPALPGEIGRVLTTGLIRRSMPLFRYELGDSVESTGFRFDCECGLQWPTIGKVHGRSEDQVRTRDGRGVSMLGYHAFKDLDGVREAQLIQVDYESFICNVVLEDLSAASSSEVESRIRQQLRSRLQVDVSVAFEYLDSIPRGANGKFKAVAVQIPPQ